MVNLARQHSDSGDYIGVSDIYRRLGCIDKSYEELLKVIKERGVGVELDPLVAYRKAEKRLDEMGYFRDGARAWDLAEKRGVEIEDMVVNIK